MGEVFVEGLGVVQLQGNSPSPEESAAIIKALREKRMAPPPPTPNPHPPQFQKPDPLRRATGGLMSQAGVAEALPRLVEPAMVAGGATAGAALGATAGPVGMGVGAAGGAAMGELAFQQTNDFLRMMGLEPLPGAIPEGPTTERVIEGGKRAAGEAALEIGTLGLAPVTLAVKNFLTPMFGKVMGVRGDAARQLARIAEFQGVKLGAVDVGGALPKGLSKVLGVFPFTGTPLRTAELEKRAQLGQRVADTLNTFAPTVTTAGTLGIDMTKAAQGSAKEFRTLASRLYDDLRATTRSVTDLQGNPRSDLIPTESTKEAIAGFVRDFRLGEINVTDAAGEVQVLRAPNMEEFEQFLLASEGLPERISVDQWARLEDMFESFVDKLNADGFTVKRVAEIKGAMEADFNDIFKGIEDQFDQNIVDAILQKKMEADVFFSSGIALFQRPTASKFARVDKRMFKAGPNQPGSINADEIFKPAFNINSAEGLRDLRKLVGDDVFRRGVRRHFEDVVGNSFSKGVGDTEVFDVDKFARNLGLLDGLKDRKGALEEMLKGTGIRVDDLVDLVENVRITSLNDPSTFVLRRVILGGASAGLAAGGAGAALLGPAAGGAGVATVTAATLLARGLSKAMASPSALKKMTRAFSPSLDDVQRRAVWVRLFRELTAGPQQRPPAPRLDDSGQ